MTASRRPQVAVVIPAHQGGSQLLEALDSAQRSHWKADAVIVIDNDSHDGSIEAVIQHRPGVIVRRNRRNVGFGAACNRGMAIARRWGYDFTLLLNQDARLDPDTLGSLLDLASQHRRAAAIGCRTLSTHCDGDGEPRLLYNGAWRRWLPTWQRLPDIGGSSADANHEPRQVDYVWGHGMLLRLEALEEEAFDPGFFMYYEDLDLCWRLQCAGWQIWCDSRTIIWHDQPDPARAQTSQLRRWQMKAASSRHFYRKRHARLTADGLWLLHSLRESAPLLLERHWLAVAHIWWSIARELASPQSSQAT